MEEGGAPCSYPSVVHGDIVELYYIYYIMSKVIVCRGFFAINHLQGSTYLLEELLAYKTTLVPP